MSRTRKEIPSLSKPILLTPEQKDLLRRRTEPFLDNIGINRSLSFLLEEVYLQGMKDAVAATVNKKEKEL